MTKLLINLLLLGITGAGKSTACTLLGAEEAAVGHSEEAETKMTHIYKVELESHILQLIDTRGFADTYKVDDKDTFVQILKTLAENNVDEIHGIFWFNNFSCRIQSDLQATAAFIKSFADYTDHDLTHNVVVMYKDMHKPGKLGAVEAIAKALGCDSDKIERHFLYMSDQFVASNPAIGQYTRADAQKFLVEQATQERKPVRVVHRNNRCTKCSARGDPRLCEPKCHVLFDEVHRGQVTHKHTGNKVKRHSKEGYAVHGEPKFVHGDAPKKAVHTSTERKHGETEAVHTSDKKMHPGFTTTTVPGDTFSIGILSFPTSGPRTISKCNKCAGDQDSKGCVFTCCEGSLACQTKCKSCGQDSLQATGCMMACCDGAKDVPCTFAHACCGALVTSKGTECTRICSACNKDPSSTTGCKMSCCTTKDGCIEVWSCCEQAADKTACTRAAYSDCGHLLTDAPCLVRCRTCHGTKGESAGCTPTKNHDAAAGHAFVDVPSEE